MKAFRKMLILTIVSAICFLPITAEEGPDITDGSDPAVLEVQQENSSSMATITIDVDGNPEHAVSTQQQILDYLDFSSLSSYITPPEGEQVFGWTIEESYDPEHVFRKYE